LFVAESIDEEERTEYYSPSEMWSEEEKVEEGEEEEEEEEEEEDGACAFSLDERAAVVEEEEVEEVVVQPAIRCMGCCRLNWQLETHGEATLENVRQYHSSAVSAIKNTNALREYAGKTPKEYTLHTVAWYTRRATTPALCGHWMSELINLQQKVLMDSPKESQVASTQTEEQQKDESESEVWYCIPCGFEGSYDEVLLHEETCAAFALTKQQDKEQEETKSCIVYVYGITEKKMTSEYMPWSEYYSLERRKFIMSDPPTRNDLLYTRSSTSPPHRYDRIEIGLYPELEGPGHKDWYRTPEAMHKDIGGEYVLVSTAFDEFNPPLKTPDELFDLAYNQVGFTYKLPFANTFDHYIADLITTCPALSGFLSSTPTPPNGRRIYRHALRFNTGLAPTIQDCCLTNAVCIPGIRKGARVGDIVVAFESLPTMRKRLEQ
jgi:hypothetical protein